jgi:hypothetical protein
LEAELASERAQREAPVDVADLPMTYRKKYKVARRGLEREFEDRVKREAHGLLDELFLPSFERDDAHSALDNMLARAVPRFTGFRYLRAVPRRAVRKEGG